MYDVDDTIAAIATSIGDSGIGIVRVSGPNALKISDKIFSPKDGTIPSGFKSYTVHYGHIVDEQKNVIDEAILTVMRAPKSYTKQDIVEINCHGGIVALRRVLELVLESGCRLAQPGEFTKRAFLNGRIDLAQAEAVNDIIQAKTDSALKIGLSQLRGGLSRQIEDLRQGLLEALSICEANIDFPEEGVGSQQDIKNVYEKLKVICNKMDSLLNSASTGRVMREGIAVVICGKPNAGKSSLLNALLKQERSIVTPIAGTTRDTIEEVIDIKGIPVKIIDTAGIITPRGLVEKHAIRRSKKYISEADLAIALFDNSRKIEKEDEFIMRRLAKRPAIAVINKIDLKSKIDKHKISKKFQYVVELSAKKMKNIGLLEEAIANLVYKGGVRAPESVMVANSRHIEKIKKAKKSVAQALDSLDNKLSLEFGACLIKEALAELGIILGKNFAEDLLDKIFSEFCIGK